MVINYKERILSLAFVLTLSMVVFVLPVSAATNTYSGKITGFNSTGPCGLDWTGNVDGTFQVNSESQVTLEITSYSGVHDFTALIAPANNIYFDVAQSSWGGLNPDTSSLLTPGVDYIVFNCQSSDIASNETYTIKVTGDLVGGTSSSASTPTIDDTVYPPDDRLNWQGGDLGAVLFRENDSEGNPVIDVYCWDGENSWLGMRVDESTPSGTSANGCDVTFYITSQGYLFNTRYDGKLYEMLCEDLVCNDPQMSYYDPNE